MQVLFEAVCDEEPCGRALAAGDMFSLAVDDVAGAGQFSGPFACPSREFGGLGREVGTPA